MSVRAGGLAMTMLSAVIGRTARRSHEDERWSVTATSRREGSPDPGDPADRIGCPHGTTRENVLTAGERGLKVAMICSHTCCGPRCLLRRRAGGD